MATIIVPSIYGRPKFDPTPTFACSMIPSSLTAESPDGYSRVDLAAVTEPVLLGRAVAAAIGVR